MFLINLCQKNNFKLYEKPVNYDQLSQIDAAFLTGTSPKLLHINQIDTFNFKVPDKTVEDLSILYNKFIDDYLATHQKFSSSGQ
ncbi:MAG: hypothetical protein HC830_04765 [Bacteroidetes bacterium]|nr:hypothetical protein [Bacteroidota bacterium]